MLALLRITFQYAAIAFLTSRLRRNCDFLFSCALVDNAPNKICTALFTQTPAHRERMRPLRHDVENHALYSTVAAGSSGTLGVKSRTQPGFNPNTTPDDTATHHACATMLWNAVSQSVPQHYATKCIHILNEPTCRCGISLYIRTHFIHFLGS